MAKSTVVILGARRTPIGAMLGVYANVAAPALGAAAIKAALASAGADPGMVDEVIMGCVLPAGQGQAPARQAALAAGLAQSVPATTVNKMCGSGMKAVMMAADQLAFAAESVRRAVAAVESGAFAEEIGPVTVKDRKGERVIDRDEKPFTVAIEKIPTLKPAFGKDGTVTAAASSSVPDGAAAWLLAREDSAAARQLKPIARIVAHASHAHAPEWFTTAPGGAIATVLKRAGWNASNVDLYEINEAFAVVSMAAMKDIGIAHDKVNVHGGACALGHPIGATGARILTTLIHALKRHGGRRGVAALCIGGGEATAVAIEL